MTNYTKHIKTSFSDFLNENSENDKWTPEVQMEFDKWKESDNVIKRKDGSYSTQDAQWKNKLKDLDELKQYYTKEFLG